MHVLGVLIRKEFLQIRRDPVILRMLLIMPLIQLVVLANAATFEVRSAALWVVDQDRSSLSTGLQERFSASGRFRIVGRSGVAGLGEEALMDGSAHAILVIPAGFGQALVREGAGAVQLVLNAENGSRAGVIQGYGGRIIDGYVAELGATLSIPGRISASADPRAAGADLRVQTRGWYNPSLDYRRFMVPGILVQLVVMVGTLTTALNIVREKEAGTLEQLNVTPLRPTVFIAAKLIPFWILGLLEFALGLLIAVVGFGVPLEGSLLLLFSGAAIFLLGSLGVGLWISTVAETQQQALFITFSLLMVYILMSGLFTPVRAMPDWVTLIAQVNPLLHFIALVRDVMLKGAGLGDVAGRLLALLVIGAGVLWGAVGQYRKQAA